MLTPKKAQFAREYLIDLNATRAAIRAGYSAKTAYSAGQRLLNDVDVQAAVAEAMQARVQRTEITADRVLEELALLAFSDLTHYVVDDAGNVQLAAHAPAGAMRALQSIKRRIVTRGSGDEAVTTREVEIRLWDKPGPLKLAGQHVGLFDERLQVRHEVSWAELVAGSFEPEPSPERALAPATESA